MNESGVKQQIVDNIQSVDTILVTVGNNPSVDELSAALGLTMHLNDSGKHATAVVSGALPPAINFLEPEKVFEASVDSLRDFVIALDKEKADHLRYKVEGDLVKIFITPYKTVITDKDLQYTQGDYNVEMVIALGVTDQEHLDKALAAHGKIFHDATVATIGFEPSALGAIDWVEESAGSLSEVVAGLAESIQDPEKPMTAQVASAFLTGIVAATERFSNDRTTSQTMSVAAVLMAAGANQQLIASKLREGAKLPMQQSGGKKPGVGVAGAKPVAGQPGRRDGGISISHRGSSAVKPVEKPAAQVTKKPVSTPSSQKPPVTPSAPTQKTEPSRPKRPASKTPDDILSDQLATVAPPAVAPPVLFEKSPEHSTPSVEKPLATPEEQPAPTVMHEAPTDPFANLMQNPTPPALDPLGSVSATDTLADIDTKNRATDPAARDAALEAVNAVVDAASASAPLDPLAAIQDAAPQKVDDAQMIPAPVAPPLPPPLPDFSQLPPLPPPPVFPPVDASITAPGLPPVAPVAPAPEFPQAPLPPEQLGAVLPTAPVAPVAPADPGQFRIPGQ